MALDVSLLSVEFFAISLVAVLGLTAFRGCVRHAIFLAVNVLFIWLVLGPLGTASTLGFTLGGYALTLLIQRNHWPLYLGLSALALVFIYLRDYEILRWVLPQGAATSVLSTIGLSFLLFRIVHVMIEARSETLGRLELFVYLNYCLAFTTFMMGPIQRYQDFYDQWYGRKLAVPITFEAHLDAFVRILLGLAKAYVVAPRVATFTLTPGTTLSALSLTDLAVGGYAFYLFLYLNFSGYCDVVIGVGSLMGIRPPENFDRPFLAGNISEFWLRMHRSLTLWLTDFVFNPLYKRSLTSLWGRAHPLLALNVSLMATMLVSGLWHGTSLSFLLFGVLHGFYLIVYRTYDGMLVSALGKRRAKQFRTRPWVRVVGTLLTFNAASVAYIFFSVDATASLMEWWRS